MLLYPSLAHRVVEPELMDDPNLDPKEHRRALKGLARINRLSDSGRIVWAPVVELAKSLGGRRLRVLDIATGSGDVPLSLARRARRWGLSLDVLGVDISPRAVEFAQGRTTSKKNVQPDKNANARDVGSPCSGSVRFETLDVFAEPLPQGYDVVMCSLFLHHLSRSQAVELLRKMADAAGHLLVVNDLERSRMGLLAAESVCRLTTTSRVVHVDGPRSVRAAFTVAEAEALARETGLEGARLVRRWPFRYLLTWRKTKN